MVMTNLFRDQLDRYGEIDITMNILEEMIRTVPDMKLIVNGDDALSAYMAMDSGNPCVYYGISRPVMRNETNEIREGRFCKKCGERLQYSFYPPSALIFLLSQCSPHVRSQRGVYLNRHPLPRSLQ